MGRAKDKFARLMGFDNAGKINELAADVLTGRYNAKHPPHPLNAAKGDGATDDLAALQALVDYISAAGGGILYLPLGNYKITGPINWKSNVSLIGAGMGRSILKPVGMFSGAIAWELGTTSSGSPMVCCDFRDLEIDGTGFTDTVPAITSKGMYIQYMKHCSFRDLYIHDTIGTGLGVDYLDDVTIDHVYTYNCGRLWDGVTGSSSGQAGIGIGTGRFTNANFTITNCVADTCGHYGIFIELQAGGTVPKGITMANNIVRNCRNVGLASMGCTNVEIANNIIYGCTSHGIMIYGNGQKDVVASDNISTDNGGSGIYVTGAISGAKIKDNHTGRNAARGIYFHVYADYYASDITGNDVFENLVGMTFDTGGSYTLYGLTVCGNIIHDNNDKGIELTAAVRGGCIKNNEIYNNSKTATNKEAIYITSAISLFDIFGNHIYDSQATKTQYYSIRQTAASTFDTVRIEANDCRGNELAASLVLAGTNTNLVNTNNLTDA